MPNAIVTLRVDYHRHVPHTGDGVEKLGIGIRDLRVSFRRVRLDLVAGRRQAVAATGFGGVVVKKRTILFRFCAVAASRNCSDTGRFRRSFSLVSPIRCFSSENSASTLLRARREWTNAGVSTSACARIRAASYQLTPSFLTVPLVHFDFSGHGPHCVGVER